MPASFSTTPEATGLIQKIAERYNANREAHGLDRVDHMCLIMDITACHANGCPLDLGAMADEEKVSAFDLSHDIVGISNYLNRDTGELEGCFVPRCALPEGVV